MNEYITYKKAAMSDIGAVTDLLLLLYGMPRDELHDENIQHLNDPSMVFYLAYNSNKPVGVTHGSLRREYVNGTNDGIKGYLEAIYVLPEYRLKGIAAKLVDEVKHWAALNGCREFASDCLLHNTESYNFHLKIGFKETERNIFFIKDIEPLTYRIVELDAALRERIQPIINESWGAPEIAINGRLWDSRIMSGLTAMNGNDVYGYILYQLHDSECEIMVLESIVQNIGVASALIEEVKKAAERNGIRRVIVQTSNDNTHAIRFYQRRGFTIRAIRLGAMSIARQLKPSIPLIGEGGIPIRDEIEFEWRVSNGQE